MKFNFSKIGYAAFSIFAGLTIGMLLASFIAISAFLNSVLAFPIQVYRQCVESAHRKRMERLFGIPKDFQLGDFKQNSEPSIWDKHIQRMEEKKKNETES